MLSLAFGGAVIIVAFLRFVFLLFDIIARELLSQNSKINPRSLASRVPTGSRQFLFNTLLVSVAVKCFSGSILSIVCLQDVEWILIVHNWKHYIAVTINGGLCLHGLIVFGVRHNVIVKLRRCCTFDIIDFHKGSFAATCHRMFINPLSFVIYMV